MENPSRRRVLTAGLTGAVATALIGSRASATTPTDPPTTEGTDGTDGTEAPTTTEAPTLPTDDDRTLLRFAQAAELAASQLYALAIEAGADESDDGRVLAAASGNHRAASDALSALIGAGAPDDAAADIVATFQGDFERADLAAVAGAGAELENTLVATHTDIVERLANPDGASRIAAILIAEAQMAAVLTHLAGNGDDLDAMFDNPAAAMAPTEV